MPRRGLRPDKTRWKVLTRVDRLGSKAVFLRRYDHGGSVLPKSMFKASFVASAVFAIAWFRMPPTTMVLRYFILYGILIVILSMLIGLPIASLIERLRIGRWWSYLTFAAATGALVGTLSSHPTLGNCARPVAGSGEQETCIENPMAITFSPWTRSQPGFAGDNPPIQWGDYIGTIAFGAIVGGVLGISFWFFYRWRPRTRINVNDP